MGTVNSGVSRCTGQKMERAVSTELYTRRTRIRLYEDIASHIEELIITGELSPGDRLPAERELAEKMHVGRGAVRESVKLLSERGLVDVRPGRGTFVSEPGGDALVSSLERFLKLGPGSYDDLLEIRQVVEVAIAGLAAQRANAKDLEDLGVTVARMDNSIESPVEFIDADLEFHLTLARATHNPVFPRLMDVFIDMLRTVQLENFRVPGAPGRGQVWHKKIYEATTAGDAQAASDAMRQHLNQVAGDSETHTSAQSG